VQVDEQANVQPELAVPQVQPAVLHVQRLPVPVIPPVQQVLQPVPTQNQGVQAEPVVTNGENLLNMPCTNDAHTPM